MALLLGRLDMGTLGAPFCVGVPSHRDALRAPEWGPFGVWVVLATLPQALSALGQSRCARGAKAPQGPMEWPMPCHRFGAPWCGRPSAPRGAAVLWPMGQAWRRFMHQAILGPACLLAWSLCGVRGLMHTGVSPSCVHTSRCWPTCRGALVGSPPIHVAIAAGPEAPRAR